MKKYIVVSHIAIISLTSIIGLSACSKGTVEAARSPVPYSASLKAPADCIHTKILATIVQTVPQAQSIDTRWQPTAGTELADFLNNDGIACSYGLQSAEIGATIKWVSGAQQLFSNRVDGWMQQGYRKVDIPNIPPAPTYFLYKPQSASQEFQIWQVQILVNDLWISINSSYLHTLNEGASLIKAALASATQ